MSGALRLGEAFSACRNSCVLPLYAPRCCSPCIAFRLGGAQSPWCVHFLARYGSSFRARLRSTSVYSETQNQSRQQIIEEYEASVQAMQVDELVCIVCSYAIAAPSAAFVIAGFHDVHRLLLIRFTQWSGSLWLVEICSNTVKLINFFPSKVRYFAQGRMLCMLKNVAHAGECSCSFSGVGSETRDGEPRLYRAHSLHIQTVYAINSHLRDVQGHSCRLGL